MRHRFSRASEGVYVNGCRVSNDRSHSNILTGQRPHVSAETVRRLVQALNVSSDYLLGLTDDPAPRRGLRPCQKRSQAADEDEPAQAMAR